MAGDLSKRGRGNKCASSFGKALLPKLIDMAIVDTFALQ